MAKGIKGNPKKPALRANVVTRAASKGGSNPKNPTKAAAKVVIKSTAKGGLKQNSPAAKIITPRSTNKLNKAPLGLNNNGRNKKPLGPVTKAHNSVAKGDVSRIRSVSQLATPKTAGGGFKSFIGGK